MCTPTHTYMYRCLSLHHIFTLIVAFSVNSTNTPIGSNSAALTDFYIRERWHCTCPHKRQNAPIICAGLSCGFLHKHQWYYLSTISPLLVLSYIVQIWLWRRFLCFFRVFFKVSRGSLCSVMHNRVQKPRRHVAPGVSTDSYRELIKEVELS